MYKKDSFFYTLLLRDINSSGKVVLWAIMDNSKATQGQIPYFDIDVDLLGNFGEIDYLSDAQFLYFKVGSHNLPHVVYHKSENNSLDEMLGTESVLSNASSLA